VFRIARRLSRSSTLLWDVAVDARLGERTHHACAQRASWLAENLCAIHGVQIERTGELPRGPVVIVANHVGYFDPMVLLSLVPAMPIAKREIGEWPLLGNSLASLGVALVRRGDPYDGARALRRAMAALEANVPVLVFPEGTTSHGDSVLPFRRGIFGIASRLGVPVVPVVLRYEGRAASWVGDEWFLPHYAKSLGRAELRVRVQFGEPILMRQQSRAYANEVRQRMLAMLDRAAPIRLARAA
jgi:1-acyl-sn-glycerol-3-phosphate acyltransferase